MAGLWKALLCLLLQVASGWLWGAIQWQYGMAWREHIPTGYWAEVDGYGVLVWEEDMDWFEDHGFDLPGNWMPAPPPPTPIRTPPTPPRTRFNLRVACKRPRLPAIDEQDDIVHGGGRASNDPPSPPTPPRLKRAHANDDEVMEALKNLGATLDQEGEEGRYEKRGFRSAEEAKQVLCSTPDQPPPEETPAPSETKFEPPQSPREMEVEDNTPPNPEEIVEAAEAAESSWPAEGLEGGGDVAAPESTWGDSWQEVDELSTVASVTLEE
eukprot:s1727_g28.t1